MRTFVLRNETHAKQLWAFLRSNWVACAQASKPLAVTVAEHKSKRSVEQNKFYWALLNEIASSAWIDGKQYPVDVWHEHCRRKFIGLVDLPGGGTAGISTTTLSVAEFSDYLERVRDFAINELGVEILEMA